MADGNVQQSVVIKPLAGHIGAEVRGLDLRQELSDAQTAEVRQALLRIVQGKPFGVDASPLLKARQTVAQA